MGHVALGTNMEALERRPGMGVGLGRLSCPKEVCNGLVKEQRRIEQQLSDRGMGRTGPRERYKSDAIAAGPVCGDVLAPAPDSDADVPAMEALLARIDVEAFKESRSLYGAPWQMAVGVPNRAAVSAGGPDSVATLEVASAAKSPAASRGFLDGLVDDRRHLDDLRAALTGHLNPLI